MTPVTIARRRTARTKLLLVEDYYLIAEVYRALLGELGYDVVGPAPTVDRALSLLEEEEMDGAVLDVTLQGRTVTPVAERLREMELPFIFLTALADLDFLPNHLSGAIRVEKPASPGELEDALRRSGLEAIPEEVSEGPGDTGAHDDPMPSAAGEGIPRLQARQEPVHDRT
jgi:DNA-binding response OmpR family regulator